MSENPEYATVQGYPLTYEGRVIGALVARLGGAVTLTPGELKAVQGIEFDGMTIMADVEESDFSSI